MDEREVKAVCEAAALAFDSEMMESLQVIGGMMEEVARSELCGEGTAAPSVAEEVSLRPDVVACAFTREELLAGAKGRQGAFVLVPRVIKG